jgi:hypothetical protein
LGEKLREGTGEANVVARAGWEDGLKRDWLGGPDLGAEDEEGGAVVVEVEKLRPARSSIVGAVRREVGRALAGGAGAGSETCRRQRDDVESIS